MGGEKFVLDTFNASGRSVIKVLDGSDVLLEEANSFDFGRCQVIRMGVDLNIKDTWLEMVFRRGPVILFISEDGVNEIGVGVNYWFRSFQVMSSWSFGREPLS